MIDPSGPSRELADEVRVELIRTAAATGRVVQLEAARLTARCHRCTLALVSALRSAACGRERASRYGFSVA